MGSGVDAAAFTSDDLQSTAMTGFASAVYQDVHSSCPGGRQEPDSYAAAMLTTGEQEKALAPCSNDETINRSTAIARNTNDVEASIDDELTLGSQTRSRIPESEALPAEEKVQPVVTKSGTSIAGCHQQTKELNSEPNLAERQHSPDSPSVCKMQRSLARTSAPPDLVHEQKPGSSDFARSQSRLRRISLSRTSASSVVIEQSVRHVEEVPRRAVVAAVIISINALVMAIAEVLIEILILAGVYPKLPFRLDFFFLTLLSALLGYQSLQGVRNWHFDTSRNALQVAALVESALIAGDILYMVEQVEKYPASIPTRMPFLALTAINLSLVIYLYIEMYLFHKREMALKTADSCRLDVVEEGSCSSDSNV